MLHILFCPLQEVQRVLSYIVRRVEDVVNEMSKNDSSIILNMLG